jgi:hypothetical protein
MLHEEGNSRVVFWQHFSKTKVVEYVLDLKVVATKGNDSTMIHLKSLEDDDLTYEGEKGKAN